MNETSGPIAPITVEDLRQKALQIKDLTEAEVRLLLQERRSKAILVGAVALVAVISIAYYLGTRRE